MLMWTFHHMKLMQSTALEQEPFDLWKTTPTPACTPFFHSFQNISERISEALPPALAVNKSPAVFIFHHTRSTDFEEELEGL